MQKSKKIISSLVILAVILSAVGFVFSNNGKSPEEAPVFTGELELKVATAFLLVNDGISEVKNFELDVVEGATAFSLLQSSGLEIDYQEYEGMGVMVEAIDGVENGADNKYWMYYLNEEMPMVSCDQQAVSAGDTVEFRFEESSF